MVYSLMAEEPVWYRSEWVAEDKEEKDKGLRMREENGSTTDAVEDMRGYYWIVSTEREEFLAVPDFMTGEEVLMKLSNTDSSFEEIVEEDDKGCKIVEDRMEVFDSFW